MNTEITLAINRLARITGSGLLAVAFLLREGTPTENRYCWYLGFGLALWCLLELFRSYAKQ